MTWTASIDGGARGNPGPAAAGVHIVDESGSVVFAGGLFLGRRTNNEAEYAGLLVALDLLQAAGADEVTIRSDSELLVRQLQGQYRVKAANLQPLYERAMTAARRIARCRFQHVRREENKQADALANEAMDAVSDVIAADPRGLWSALDRPKPAARPDTAPSSPTGEAVVTKQPARKAPATAAPPGSVTVAVIKGPRTRGCPAGNKAGQTFIFTTKTPADLCVEACASVIDAVVSLRSAPRQDARDLQPLTITCGRAECGAVFQLTCT